MEVELLQVLQQDPALALDDRLRQPRGAGGVEHPERVGEGHPLEGEVGACALGHELLPGDRPAEPGEVGSPREVGEDDGALEGRHLVLEAGEDLGAVEVLASVAVSVRGQQDLGLDLGEAVDDAGSPEVGRARGPDGADRGGGKEADDRLGDVGEVGDDAVAVPDADRPQAGRGRRHLRAQVSPAQLAQRAQLRGVQDRRRGRVAVAEHVLGVVDPGPGEPLGARHLAGAEGAGGGNVRAHLEEVPDRAPEGLQVGDRPLPQRGVVVEGEAPLGLEPSPVLGHP